MDFNPTLIIYGHDSMFDFYCFNETNLKPNGSHDFEIENYQSHFLHSIESKAKGSGLAIYCRKNLAEMR